MQIVPMISVPSQNFSAVLAGQNCKIKAYQKTTGFFLDISVSGTPLLSGALCQDRVRLVRQAYLNFVGDLSFIDTQGFDPPRYEGLGTRWILMYLEASDL